MIAKKCPAEVGAGDRHHSSILADYVLMMIAKGA
jgi:hypothetical protein